MTAKSTTTKTATKTTNPNTVEMTEVVLARSIGAFALVLIALALPDLLQTNGRQMGFDYALFVGLIPTLTIAAMIPRKSATARRLFAGTVATMILLGFLLWHLGLIGNGMSPDARPWSWGIAGAGVGLAAVASNIKSAARYGLLFAVLVLIIPLLPAGSTRQWADSWQDALLTIAMTSVIVAPIWALRRAVCQQDRAALDAVAKFADAARAEAESGERLRLDALTHDIVLSTLIVASQARSTEVEEAAARAACEALAQLEMVKRDAETSDDGFLTVEEWLGRLQAAVGSHGVALEVERAVAGEGAPMQIPILVAKALRQAATEAVRNAAEHAVGSTIRIKVALAQAAIQVTVSDNGAGLNLGEIPAERMGVRVSILERMRAVGGQAVIDGSNGTTVTLTWDGGAHGPRN